jgi:pantoate--beta-alanine ligase
VIGPRVATSRVELSAALRDLRADGRSLALVPTMGALHEGHRSLLLHASELADDVVVSIYVNPLQFGAGEDLARYPRTLDADLEMCTEQKVAVVFAPDEAAMFPLGQPSVRIAAGPLGGVLEGAARPGHFDGVLTIVAKLLGLTSPDVAVFGEKDAQQLLLVRRMVSDLDLPVRIASVPVFRDPDGLAVSSRNQYLDRKARVTALALSRALDHGRAAAPAGAAAIRAAAQEVLVKQEGFTVDYCALVDPANLTDIDDEAGSGPALLLVAGVVAGTRLIDAASVAIGAGAPA